MAKDPTGKDVKSEFMREVSGELTLSPPNPAAEFGRNVEAGRRGRKAPAKPAPAPAPPPPSPASGASPAAAEQPVRLKAPPAPIQSVGDSVRCQLRATMVNGQYGHQIRMLAERVVAATGAPAPSSWPLAKRNEFWGRFLAALDGGKGADAVAAWQASVTHTPNSIMAYRQTVAMAAVIALGQGM